MSKKIKSIEEIKKVKRKRASVSQKKAGNPRRNSENAKRPAIKHLVSGAANVGLTVLISVLIIFAIVQAGSLTPSASPTATGYTLSDIYNRLNTNISSTEANHLFSPSGSPAGTFYTLTEIYNKIPPIVANTVKLGTTYLGVAGTLIPSGGDAAVADLFNLKTANLIADWTLDTGTLNLACNTATFDATGNLVANAYDGAGTGFNRWCITDSGNAVDGNILSGKIAWVDGAAVTGAMADKEGDNGSTAQAAAAGVNYFTAPAGFYDGRR